MKKLLLMGIAGAVGAMTRVRIGEWIPLVSGFPIGTLFVNLVGTFLLCYVIIGVFVKLNVKKALQDIITVGFLGSFTTFSALSIETVLLIENGQAYFAMLYIGMSIVGGLSAGVFGNFLGRKLVKS